MLIKSNSCGLANWNIYRRLFKKQQNKKEKEMKKKKQCGIALAFNLIQSSQAVEHLSDEILLQGVLLYLHSDRDNCTFWTRLKY